MDPPPGFGVIDLPTALWVLLVFAATSGILLAALARRRSGREPGAGGYTALLLAVPDLVFVADVEGAVLEWHSSPADGLGVRALGILGRNVREVLPPEVAGPLRVCIREALQTPRPVVQPFTLAVRGELRRFEARMVRHGADRVLCVVCERTGAGTDGETLPETRAPSWPAAPPGGVSIWDHDLSAGTIRVDPVVEQWLGTGKGAPRSFGAWLEHVHPADRERLLALGAGSATAAGVQEDGDTVAVLPDVEYRLTHGGGSTRWVLHRAQRIPAADGSPARIVGTVTDISAWTPPGEGRDQVRALLRRVVDANEEERRRIARELHDDLNQKVAELHIRSTILGTHLGEEWPKLQDQVGELVSSSKDLAEAVRNVAHMLHPVVLDQAGLVPALRALADQVRLEGVEIRMDAPADPGEVSPAAALCLYRVAQEALRNVVRHADSPVAEVSLREVGTMLELRVKDSGVGIDPSRATASGGLGLTAMRERVTAIGGTFVMESAKGKGAEVVARVPKGRA